MTLFPPPSPPEVQMGRTLALRPRSSRRSCAYPDQFGRSNPLSQSMIGQSGKTATKSETQTPNAPTSYEDRPPIHATADLVACGEKVISAREITTKNGRTCVLTTESGTDYWGSELLLKQLEKSPDRLPDVVVEAVSANGRKYRTFLKAKNSGRRFGRSVAGGE